jgi:hypothetical protein
MSSTLYKLDSEILTVLNINDIENKYYNSNEISKLLSIKLKENKINNVIIVSDQVSAFINRYTRIKNNKVSIGVLLNLIMMLSIKKKIPDCSYYTYDEIPNYSII